jgi:hypothetical protein
MTKTPTKTIEFVIDLDARISIPVRRLRRTNHTSSLLAAHAPGLLTVIPRVLSDDVRNHPPGVGEEHR